MASAVAPALGGLAPPLLAVRALSGAMFIAAGAVVWERGAPRRLGYLFVWAGVAMCLINLGLWPGSFATTLRMATGAYAPFGAALGHLLLAYPTGRLRARLDRFTVGALYGMAVAHSAAQLFVGDATGQRFCAPVGCPDLLVPALISSDTAARAVQLGVLVLYPAVFALFAVAVVRRWLRATPAGRRALRPVVLSSAAGLGLGLTMALLRGVGLAAGGSTRLVIAVVWGVSSSGIAVWLLVDVLRTRLVLYGMGDLVTRLGGTDRVDAVTGVVARLLGDPSVEILPSADGGRGFLDAAGGTVTAPARGQSWLPVGVPPVGVIVHDAAVEVDPAVADAVTRALQLFLDNVRLQDRLRAQLDEVQESRARIVAAADAERRRIERDLHDGAQQQLVVSALSVRLARQRLRSAPDRADELLDQAESYLRTALGDVRELARGLAPAILADAGLGAAVESLTQRLPLAVTLTDEIRQRSPLAVETAAYFCVCEALANVIKHAEVQECAVRLWGTGRGLHLEVADAGRGGADPHGAGSGLAGLVDRLAAVQGTLTVRSTPGSGTTLRADIPLPDARPDPTPVP